jgi:hypothetical protein
MRKSREGAFRPTAVVLLGILSVAGCSQGSRAKYTGYISHTQYSFGSILKFIEDNWNLGHLGTADVGAKSIVDCFDFTQAPRAFVPISSKYSKEYFERRPPSGLPVDTE